MQFAKPKSQSQYRNYERDNLELKMMDNLSSKQVKGHHLRIFFFFSLSLHILVRETVDITTCRSGGGNMAFSSFSTLLTLLVVRGLPWTLTRLKPLREICTLSWQPAVKLGACHHASQGNQCVQGPGVYCVKAKGWLAGNTHRNPQSIHLALLDHQAPTSYLYIPSTSSYLTSSYLPHAFCPIHFYTYSYTNQMSCS